LRSDDLDVTDERVMPLLCGGNLDMTTMQAILIHALTHRKQILRFRVKIDDRPGKMAEIAGVIADHEANIQTVRHDRAVEALDVGEAYLQFQVETSGIGHARAIIRAIGEHGYEVERIDAEQGATW
ncbi:MAG: threonine ammonia-lyase, partial [Halobacteriales archaeon]|nr:threonine ammonia-lyase [Halobacteriales archaeon]